MGTSRPSPRTKWARLCARAAAGGHWRARSGRARRCTAQGCSGLRRPPRPPPLPTLPHTRHPTVLRLRRAPAAPPQACPRDAGALAQRAARGALSGARAARRSNSFIVEGRGVAHFLGSSLLVAWGLWGAPRGVPAASAARAARRRALLCAGALVVARAAAGHTAYGAREVRVGGAVCARAPRPAPRAPRPPRPARVRGAPRGGARPRPPPPSPCTNWTRLVLPPVLSGHVSSFPPY